MKLSYAIILLLLGYVAFLTLERSVAVYPSVGCAPLSGAGFNIKWLGFRGGSSSDENCNYLEAARTDPNEDRATLMRCSTPASIKVFGAGTDAIRACVDYSGSEAAIARVDQQLAICRKRSKKIRYRLTFRVKKRFNRCMSAI
jgi:hypothetical protein